MKRLLMATVLVLASVPIQAQHRHPYGYATGASPHHHNHRHHSHGTWLAPLIVGGVVGYALTRPAPQVIEQPVYVERSVPVYVEQPRPTCTQWREIQGNDGRIYRERICNN